MDPIHIHRSLSPKLRRCARHCSCYPSLLLFLLWSPAHIVEAETSLLSEISVIPHEPVHAVIRRLLKPSARASLSLLLHCC